jgi:hypothetical protein
LNIDVEYFSAESGLDISSFFPPSLQKQAMADKQETGNNKMNPEGSCKSCPNRVFN